jgi:hypothetical protein
MMCRRAVLGALLLGFASTAAPAAERSCAVAGLTGTAIEIDAGSGWRALEGAALPAGAMRLRTGADTRAEIRCSDGIAVTLGIATEVELAALTGAAGPEAGVLIRLARGIIGLVAPERTTMRFEVETPLAIASVRSTEWLVDANPGVEDAVFVRKGLVLVTAGGETYEVRAGEGVTILPSKRAKQPPAPWGAARIAAAGARLGHAWP